MKRDQLLFHADVQTVDPAGTRAEALCFRGERLLAVGRLEEVERAADYPAVSFDPLAGMRSAMARTDRRGRVHEPEERLALHEAVALFTCAAAEVAGCAQECGSLEAGKRADLVVLDRALVDGEALAAARVEATVLGGDRGPRQPGRDRWSLAGVSHPARANRSCALSAAA